MKVLIIVGSLRNGSLNAKLAENFGRIFRDKSGAEVEFADINLPTFNADDYQNPVDAVKDLRAKIADADLVYVVSPEYNRSIPGGVKNALDWTGWQVDNSWNGKKVVIAGASLGALGTALMQYDVRRILSFIGAKIFAESEFMLGNAGAKFAEDGTFVDDKDEAFAEKFVESTVKFAQND